MPYKVEIRWERNAARTGDTHVQFCENKETCGWEVPLSNTFVDGLSPLLCPVCKGRLLVQEVLEISKQEAVTRAMDCLGMSEKVVNSQNLELNEVRVVRDLAQVAKIYHNNQEVTISKNPFPLSVQKALENLALAEDTEINFYSSNFIYAVDKKAGRTAKALSEREFNAVYNSVQQCLGEYLRSGQITVRALEVPEGFTEDDF